MWGQAALGTAWPGRGCRKGGPQWLLRPGLRSLVPARRPWASADLSWDHGSLGSEGDPEEGREEREGRDELRMVPRAAHSGERPGRIASAAPKHIPEAAGCPGVGAAGSGAAASGLYRSLWKFVLEEASWSGRGLRVGIVQTVGTLLLQILFLSQK